ncbi:MAG: hypothetical protein LBG59_05325 [Candidatus Peribacteria bacterium]|jgi:hypothetical protein|nr:hypothetical protein [Candidatus Peribacteria bacterium]
MLQVIDQVIPIVVVPLLQQVQIGQVAKTTTCDEEVVIPKLTDEIVATLEKRGNDLVQVVITYQVQENGLA